MKNIIFLKKNCPPESLRVNTNYPAVPAGAVITELNKMDPLQLWGIDSCRASSRNNENLSVLFSKHNVWHQALPSACLYLAALPARAKACGSLVRDLVRKKAKTIGVLGRKDLRANQKRIHAKPHYFHLRSTSLAGPPLWAKELHHWCLLWAPTLSTVPSTQNSSRVLGLAGPVSSGPPHHHIKES